MDGALYCVCKDGVGDQALQKAIDYACGAGADCSPILQNGVCYQPNTVKDHCNYAVNSYFQRKGQAQGSCDFAGAATPSQNPPSKWPPLSSHLKKFCTFLTKFPFFLILLCLFDLQLQHLHVFTLQALGMFLIKDLADLFKLIRNHSFIYLNFKFSFFI
ncbi:hypothetical protein V8G54_016425 [Vigna mungo]|uniref:X8 domain-containing protein n=1 Tax=Vigna mungo TaxID=3915 RepID=A0AAQ3NK79_VIGMU